MTKLDAKQIDKLATAMANHLPCTPASIVDAINKATREVEAADKANSKDASKTEAEKAPE